jgi:hypothetical protein
MQSQIHELGFFWEGNFGDVGPTTYVAPNELWYTLQMEQSPRHSWRVSYIQSTITSNDLDSKNLAETKEAIIFENNVKENYL